MQFIKIFIKKFLVIISGKKVKFNKGSNFSISSKFGGYNVIGQNTWINGFIDYGSYIGDDCIIDGNIGKYCSISSKVVVLTGTHPTSKFVSTSPSFYSIHKQNGLSYTKKQLFNEKKYFNSENKIGVSIENDVWIGYGVTLMGGVKISNGAIIAANSYVTKDVEAYSIVAGNPAKVIKYRFNNEQIDNLLEFRWWDKDEEWIMKNSTLFVDIELFGKEFF